MQEVQMKYEVSSIFRIIASHTILILQFYNVFLLYFDAISMQLIGCVKWL